MKESIAKSWLVFCLTAAVMSLPAIALAMGGTVQYPDGSPVKCAEVSVIGGGEGKATVTCDSQGRFELSGLPEEEAMVKIKVEDKDYAQMKLPASLFQGGNVAIVLQAKPNPKTRPGRR